MLWHQLKTWIGFILPLTAAVVFHGVSGTSCKFCQMVNNYSDCLQNGKPVECTEALVNVTHLLLSSHNPALAAVAPRAEFECFQVNYTVYGIANFQMGCTFAGSPLCDGWKRAVECRITNSNGTIYRSSGTSSTPNAEGASSTTIPPASTYATSHPTSSSTPATGRAVSSSTPRQIDTTTTVKEQPSDGNGITTEATSPSGRQQKSRSHGNVASMRFDLLLSLVALLLWHQIPLP